MRWIDLLLLTLRVVNNIIVAQIIGGASKAIKSTD
jgi:hypothetical protein